jgi:hypothetical protein
VPLRLGESLYKTLTPVRSPAGSRVAARMGAGGALEIVIPPLGFFTPQSFTEMGFAAVGLYTRFPPSLKALPSVSTLEPEM